jgi:hypothetical protein
MRPHRAPWRGLGNCHVDGRLAMRAPGLEKLAFALRGRHISQRTLAGAASSPMAVVRRVSVIGLGVCQFLLLVRAGAACRLLPLGQY